MVETITKAAFLEGLEKGYITDWGKVDNYVYGKDSRVPLGSGDVFKMVRALST
jgi:hypothetical protein